MLLARRATSGVVAWLGPACCEPELSPVSSEGSCLPAKEQGPILECHWCVLSTVGPGRDLVGKHPGKEELLQEVVELSAVCQQCLTRLRPAFNHPASSMAPELAVTLAVKLSRLRESPRDPVQGY